MRHWKKKCFFFHEFIKNSLESDNKKGRENFYRMLHFKWSIKKKKSVAEKILENLLKKQRKTYDYLRDT